MEMKAYGWGQCCSDLSVIPVAGDHDTMMGGESAKFIAGTFSEMIQKLESN